MKRIHYLKLNLECSNFEIGSGVHERALAKCNNLGTMTLGEVTHELHVN